MVTALNIEAIRDALEMHMERTGMNGRKLSRLAGLNETAVRDLMGKVVDPRMSTLMALAGALKISPESLFGGTVEIAGTINEHGEILPLKQNGKPPEMVARPPGLVGDALAYLVAGDGLWPAFRDGDIIFVGREHEANPDEFLGCECVVQLAATGALLLRTVKQGSDPNRFTLSLHNIANDLLNVQLAWAARVVCMMRDGKNRLVD